MARQRYIKLIHMVDVSSAKFMLSSTITNASWQLSTHFRKIPLTARQCDLLVTQAIDVLRDNLHRLRETNRLTEIQMLVVVEYKLVGCIWLHFHSPLATALTNEDD